MMEIHITSWMPDWHEDPFLSSIIRLRRSVFVTEQNCPIDDEPDPQDAIAIHIGLFHGVDTIGCARLFINDDGTAKIGRVAVALACRRTGVGHRVMQAALDYTSKAGCHEVGLESQTHAIAFYEALGFVAFGPVFDDCNIPHRKMKRDLTQ